MTESKISPKPKAKSKPKPKSTPKTKVKPKPKESKQKSEKPEKSEKRKIIVESMGSETSEEIDENKYSSKLKVLLNKIKGQNSFSDDRIRFGWKK